MRDGQFYVIEAIKGHTGSAAVPSALTFIVKWIGYPEAENSVEPWSSRDMQNNVVVHDYLRNHGMERLIPARFRSIRHTVGIEEAATMQPANTPALTASHTPSSLTTEGTKAIVPPTSDRSLRPKRDDRRRWYNRLHG
jgi:hypothetical protein